MDPIRAIGKAPMFGNLISTIDGGVEVLDDLNDHWTTKSHKTERKLLIEDLQDLAAAKSIRVTILRYAPSSLKVPNHGAGIDVLQWRCSSSGNRPILF
jgi:PhoD related phosphatase